MAFTFRSTLCWERLNPLFKARWRRVVRPTRAARCGAQTIRYGRGYKGRAKVTCSWARAPGPTIQLVTCSTVPRGETGRCVTDGNRRDRDH